MKPISRYRVSFHVSHPNIPAAVIEDAFNLPIKFSQSVGEPRKTKGGKMLGGKYRMTNVHFHSHKDPLNFNETDLVSFINNLIVEFDYDFVLNLSETGGSCHFMIGVYTSDNVMIELDKQIIKSLSSLNIGIKFDVYGGED